MSGIEPVDVAWAGDRDSNAPALDAAPDAAPDDATPADIAEDIAEDIFYRALNAGLGFKVSQGNVLTLTPPLTIAEGELDRALDILEACIGEVG